MEEADVRYAEVKKCQYEFNRDIVNGAVSNVRLMIISAPYLEIYFRIFVL